MIKSRENVRCFLSTDLANLFFTSIGRTGGCNSIYNLKLMIHQRCIRITVLVTAIAFVNGVAFGDTSSFYNFSFVCMLVKPRKEFLAFFCIRRFVFRTFLNNALDALV